MVTKSRPLKVLRPPFPPQQRQRIGEILWGNPRKRIETFVDNHFSGTIRSVYPNYSNFAVKNYLM